MIFQISRISRTFVQIAENNAAVESQVPGGTGRCTLHAWTKSDRVASIQCHHIYTPQVTHMHSRSTMKAMEKYDVVAEASSHFKFRLKCGRHEMIYLQDTSDAERKQKVVR